MKHTFYKCSLYFVFFFCRRDTNSNAAIIKTNDHTASTSKKSYGHPDLYNRNLSKKLREMGMSYISQYDGKEQAARKIGDTCPKNCSYKCQFNFDSNDRKTIHQSFWSLSKIEKLEYYEKYVERISAKRSSQGSIRSCSFHYYFPFKGRRLQVCQIFFSKTLDISPRRIYWHFKKILNTKK